MLLVWLFSSAAAPDSDTALIERVETAADPIALAGIVSGLPATPQMAAAIFWRITRCSTRHR